jgi:hypothetical protein
MLPAAALSTVNSTTPWCVCPSLIAVWSGWSGWQQILLDDRILKIGVNIGGDVIKLAADFGIQVCPGRACAANRPAPRLLLVLCCWRPHASRRVTPSLPACLQTSGTLELSDVAHGRQLRAVAGVTANIQPKRWSLAGAAAKGPLGERGWSGVG